MAKLSIVSWNVNGVRAAARNGLSDFISKKKPDILCMQETKAHLSEFPEELKKLKGYELYSSNGEKKGYSGVAVLTKLKPKKVIDKMGIKEFDREGRLLLLEFDKFYLFNIYFPNSQRGLLRLDYKMRFNEALLKFVSKYKDKPMILTGDFNVAHTEMDIKNPKQNEKNAGFTPEERSFVDKMISNGWVDTFRHLNPGAIKYTWWTYRFNARKRNIGWRIDYFFIHKKFLADVKKSLILDSVQGSDHCPVEIELAV